MAANKKLKPCHLKSIFWLSTEFLFVKNKFELVTTLYESTEKQIQCFWEESLGDAYKRNACNVFECNCFVFFCNLHVWPQN